MKTASITLINETDNTRDWLELNRTETHAEDVYANLRCYDIFSDIT